MDGGRMHGQFFKVMFGEFKKRLRIPDAFEKHLLEESSDTKTLIDSNGRCWHVRVKRSSDGFYFEDGWEKFSSIHLLSLGEVLVFSYDGDMKFNVQIFSRNACERHDTLSGPCSQDETNQQGKRKRKGPCSRTSKEDCKLGGKHPRHCPRPGYTVSSEGPIKVDKIGAKDAPHCFSPQSPQLVAKRGRPHSASGYGVPLTKLNRTIKSAGMEEKDATHGSTRPYFVIKVNHYVMKHPWRLAIPTSIGKIYLPRSTTNVTLQNLEGQTWTMKIYISPRLHCFYAGWKMFLIDNNLEEGDFCAFEILDEWNIRVHISRDGDQESCILKKKQSTKGDKV